MRQIEKGKIGLCVEEEVKESKGGRQKKNGVGSLNE